LRTIDANDAVTGVVVVGVVGVGVALSSSKDSSSSSDCVVAVIVVDVVIVCDATANVGQNVAGSTNAAKQSLSTKRFNDNRRRQI